MAIAWSIVFIHLAAAVVPKSPKLVSDTWEWCDEGAGKHRITLWPDGDKDRAQAVNITAGTSQWIHWLHPVGIVHWICDGMEDVQRTTFVLPREWWNVTYTVETKPLPQLKPLPQFKRAGRLHFGSFDVTNTAKPRNLVVRGGKFVDRVTGKAVLLEGTNVVMKGPPWIPSTEGNTVCHDKWWSHYTCKTFTKHDAQHVRDMGWNFIRLGVVWAGGQPTEEPVLDAAWLARLHALLDVCLEYGIHVLLDVHQDAVGTATCGEGVPQWFSAKATPNHIGKPLIPILNLSKWPKQADGLCMVNDTVNWAMHKGEEDYNTKNKCCLRYNQGGTEWNRLIDTWQAQETIHYLLRNHEGRAYYARYIGLLAEAVRDYPNVFGIETMNEPPTIERDAMFYTWRAAHEEVRAVIPDMAVSVQDAGQAPLYLSDIGLWPDQIYWLHYAENLFYAFHWYSFPSDPKKAVRDAVKQSKMWGMPALMTEMRECKVKIPAVAAGIGYSFWEYSNYCDTYPSHACLAGGTCDFGACITGTNGDAYLNLTCPDHSGSDNAEPEPVFSQIVV